MGNWGMRVSKEGYDVLTCSDKDLVMSSNFNLLKSKAVGTTAGSVAHGLSYIPVFFAMETDGTTGTFVGSGSSGSVTSYADSTYIHASFYTTKYYIFYSEI